MRLVLPVLALLSAVAVLPVPAEAHLCSIYDAVCLVECMWHDRTGGDPCDVHNGPPPGFGWCPDRDIGFVVDVNGQKVPACVGLA